MYFIMDVAKPESSAGDVESADVEPTVTAIAATKCERCRFHTDTNAESQHVLVAGALRLQELLHRGGA